MLDLSKNLKNQYLVIYEFKKQDEKKSIFGHSFMPKKEATHENLEEYFKIINATAQQAGIKEVIEFIGIHSIYSLNQKTEMKYIMKDPLLRTNEELFEKSITKKEWLENAKKDESQTEQTESS